MNRLILVLLMATLAPATALAQLYGITTNGYYNGNPGNSSLYSIDPVTGAGTLIGDMGYAVNSIAVDPTTGTMYASTTAWNSSGTGTNGQGLPGFNGLLTVDALGGAATEVGGYGGSFTAILGLTFDSTGQLWGWHDPSVDDPVKIDKLTGAITTVGPGTNTARQVLAFDSSDVLRLFQDSTVYIVNQADGTVSIESTLSADPGAGGGVIDPAGSLWAPRDQPRLTQDSFIRITDFFGDSYFDIDTDIDWLNGVTLGDVDVVMGTARFRVTKTFSDGSDGDVEVTLTCNSGLPLEQSFTISGGGPGVTFVVTDLPDAGADCEVTESGGHDNYTSVMNGGVGCEWTGVTGGLRGCRIVNEANPATYTVTKEWVIQDERLDEVDYSVDVSIFCDSDILAVGGVSTYVGSSTTVSLSGEDSVDVMVETLFGPANCYAEEDIVQSGVESEGSDECSGAELGAGGSAECVFTNTVFFEGIPTLSQYGMALMALLMLGMGFVGMRRFI